MPCWMVGKDQPLILFVSTKTIDVVVYGLNSRKSMLIISDHADRIAKQLLSNRRCGVTFLNGQGAFSQHEKKVILTITRSMDFSKIKALVLEEDPNAFIVVNETIEVLGTRQKNGLAC